MRRASCSRTASSSHRNRATCTRATRCRQPCRFCVEFCAPRIERTMKPTRIPLFPLDVVLLPGMALPLHIFEPRYKIMIGRCMNKTIEFGVILAAEKGIAHIGCTAEIALKLKDYHDGRMDIMTEGRSVFQMLELLEEKEYYEAMVDYPTDDAAPLDARREARLTQMFQQAHLLLAGQEWAVANTDTDISLAYRMAARLPLELAE